MTKYGVLLALPNGNPSVTPDSIPLILYEKVSLNSQYNGGSNSAIVEGNTVNQKVEIASTRTNTAAEISAVEEGGLFNVSVPNYRRAAFTLEVYSFTVTPQALPGHGIVIWNESGTLVLTSESRVLTDLAAIGTPGATTGEINIDVIMPGKWVASPMGLRSVIIHVGPAPSGQLTFQSVDMGTSHHNDTNGTRAREQSSTATSGATIEATNSGIVITAISTAACD